MRTAKVLFCYEVSFLMCVDIRSAAFFQCGTLKKGSRFDVNTDQETDFITEKSFSKILKTTRNEQTTMQDCIHGLYKFKDIVIIWTPEFLTFFEDLTFSEISK